jgi:NADH-quinone oxidoreductase subunit L
MFRLIGLTFWGESRADPHVAEAIHESPPVMTIPLWLLAIPSVLLGLALTWPGPPLGPLFGMDGLGALHQWLQPIFQEGVELLGQHEAEYQLFGIDGMLLGASVAVATIGMVVAWQLFGVEVGPLRRRPRPELVRSLAARVPFLYRASLNKWWFDELNDLLFVRIGGRVAEATAWFDREVVDGIVNDIGSVTRAAGRNLSRIQTGRVQNYALGITIGLIVMIASYIVIVGNGG